MFLFSLFLAFYSITEILDRDFKIINLTSLFFLNHDFVLSNLLKGFFSVLRSEKRCSFFFKFEFFNSLIHSELTFLYEMGSFYLFVHVESFTVSATLPSVKRSLSYRLSCRNSSVTALSFVL